MMKAWIPFLLIPVAVALTGAAKKERGEPGVVVRFEGGGKSDLRVDRLVALHVAAGGRPSLVVPAGNFKATFEADVQLKLRDEITFGVAGRGGVKLTVNGDVALERAIDSEAVTAAKPVKLAKGKNRIVMEYQSPEAGDAWLRLYWSSAEFAMEPVPPTVLSHVPGDEKLEGAKLTRQGKELVQELRCLKCHDGGAAASSAGWPGDAPSLENIGARLRRDWLAHWVNDPRAMRHDATMPKVFTGGEAGAMDARAMDVAAYLASLGNAADGAEEKEINADSVVAGGRLFAYLRCAGCHTRPDKEEVNEEYGRTPLAQVRAKFRHGALVDYLKAPSKHYGGNPMPDFKLSDDEASKLAAYLIAKSSKTIDPAGKGQGNAQGDAKRGMELVRSSGCLNCHSMGDGAPIVSTLQSPALKEIGGGKFGGVCSKFDYALGDGARKAIKAFEAFGAASGSMMVESAAEAADQRMRALNCRACHAMDGEEDVFTLVSDEVSELAVPDPNEVFSEEEQLSADQSPPMLTWTGEKLKAEWMADFIDGKKTERLRPWLRARMPAFAGHGKVIAAGLAAQHGFSPKAAAPIEPSRALAEAGRTLVGTNGGFSCIACHRVGEAKASGVFEAPGINLSYADERLNKHFYDRWVINPMRVQPDTKMPTFALPDGSSSIGEILGGDARKQYEAVYQYLRAGRSIEPPGN